MVHSINFLSLVRLSHEDDRTLFRFSVCHLMGTPGTPFLGTHRRPLTLTRDRSSMVSFVPGVGVPLFTIVPSPGTRSLFRLSGPVVEVKSDTLGLVFMVDGVDLKTGTFDTLLFKYNKTAPRHPVLILGS